ncbi:MAG TPA: AraC family transcriptional regulator [Mobilitalea sp.]|nr:AraC family transcriptional regulator [Mobilitalea sp.]
MNNPKDNQPNADLHIEFWDNLQSEILDSNHTLTSEDLQYFVEKNFMFSLFFRGTSYKELLSFKNLFHMKDSGYLILIELIPAEKLDFTDFTIDEYEFYSFLKHALAGTINAIGPMISNRISILVSDEVGPESISDSIQNSINITRKLVDAIHNELHTEAFAGIGNTQSLQSIYSSFIEALSCMHRNHPGQIIHVQELGNLDQEFHYEYIEAEKHMLDSIRLRKVDAYDYFVLMMDYVKPLNDNAKRNKIIEALVLAAHTAHIDGNVTGYFSYTEQVYNSMKLKGNDLIDWAYQRFMHITGFVKPQNSFDYTNKIVLATKEYLEANYAEEISLENVAEQVNISPQYFSKLIKKNTGFNFIDWLSMLRVKKAKELLSNSNYTVKEVCFMVGYKDPNYFSRIFKKKIGITPSAFIKNRTYLNNKS